MVLVVETKGLASEGIRGKLFLKNKFLKTRRRFRKKQINKGAEINDLCPSNSAYLHISGESELSYLFTKANGFG